ncbi:MAG: FecR domain-containing protein [Fibrobacterota bacterium]|nr:FecR domain-containing protein [Fibrobacterota bacterium]QQS03114.1 MAG: FecR domain-containing protein [Fibrobacterota bacterium]
MSGERDWERTLREDQYDLPAETWQRMENDMRGWLAAQTRSANATSRPAPAPWWATLLRPSRWGVALAGLAIAGAVFHFQPGATDDLAWQVGQQLSFDGERSTEWTEARCEVQGTGAKLTLARLDDQSVQLRLDRGQATFYVQPRRAGETFQVDLTRDCQVQVVGTVFSVGRDSLNAWVAVQEGRVRLQASQEGQFIDQGGRAQCPVAQAAPRVTSANQEAPAKDTSRIAEVVAAPVSNAIAVPSCNEVGPCVAVLSAFVRQHPDHPAVSEVSLRWGRLAARGGDPRDALVGYSHVRSPVLMPMARLEGLQLRAREFGEALAAADSLDRWLAGLRSSDRMWKPVAQARLEIYRRQGDDSGARKLQEKISGTTTAESRGR